MEVNPKLLRRINITKSADANNATSATIYTTPTDQDFYLVAAYLATIKDATATSTSERILATINGASTNILRFLSFTLTAETRDTQITLPIPVKIDRGTTITVNNGTGNANISTTGGIYGYVDETTKA